MLNADYLARKFNDGLAYADYVATGKPDQQAAWNDAYENASITAPQRTLLAGFERDMKILVLSGVWCGDCVQQCPLLQRIAEVTDRIDLRFLDRDKHADLASQVMINQGLRVPTAVFMAEDNEFVGLFGDRTLTRYRAVAAKHLGAACPLPGAPVPAGERAATLQDWLDEVERVQLLLRLSPRLRQIHGD